MAPRGTYFHPNVEHLRAAKSIGVLHMCSVQRPHVDQSHFSNSSTFFYHPRSNASGQTAVQGVEGLKYNFCWSMLSVFLHETQFLNIFVHLPDAIRKAGQ